ncbi:hypothetical protein Q2K19_22030 [Micromonospora soli]|uniref:hypothetical protein n=1 Tax=Micromonospora sp. NBRC 110009 TaxID=3061627 RepID=UPI0026726F1C|nr:hypothetical protein [Micromonospora sp. NBRC 110009]WKT96856.1 hypothetical protein Q2K19_22030 [Micromonospora sp. NBRC 110009]
MDVFLAIGAVKATKEMLDQELLKQQVQKINDVVEEIQKQFADDVMHELRVGFDLLADAMSLPDDAQRNDELAAARYVFRRRTRRPVPATLVGSEATMSGEGMP